MKLHAFALVPLLAAAASAAAAPQAAPRGLQPRDLATLDRYSSPTLSPDGRLLVFARRVVDFDANKASTSLWIEDLFARDAAPPVRLTPEGWNVNSPAFSPDGATVYFLSAKNGSQQLYAIPARGGQPRQLTDLPLDVGSYRLSPDGKRVALSLEVFPECGGDLGCTKGKLDERAARKSSGVLYERLFVRHWDTWSDGRLNRVFVLALGEAPAKAATLVGADVVGDVPSKPFGDASDYAWSPDGATLVLSARKADREEAWSTNFDLYLVKADGTGPAKNLTEANKAWDAGPVFSADGRTLYYRAMRRPGFEADRFALMAMDLATGASRELAPRWDASADGITLSPDGRRIYTTAQELGRHPLFAVRLDDGEVETIVADGSVSAFALAGPTLALARNTLRTGDVIHATSPDGKAPLRAITPSAAEMLPDVRFGDYEQFRFVGWNGETVHGYVVKPWNYRKGRKYPVAFLIHGGPQGSFGDGWSYRWNPQTYAGQGWAVVMIDFHGSTGYGQAFTDAISQHWGDRPLEDLQKGWAAALAKYPFLDGERACALGASYGGYMVNWIAGNWNEPWKCLVNHNGVFDTRSMGLVTEELWFTEWEFGGTVHDVPENYERFNPARHIHKWRVPMLVVAGQNDFRVPIDQSLSTFTALQRRGIPSQLLYFPDENHWVLKPQNSVLWHDTVNAWLHRYLGQ
ncbi:alpha/beta hydrolase family protein [Vulcaniibacterium gelatinicum]|uniref:S9 family peptidase n=1 Tax=Vulcaniibacterium gelatinicum TaxID=2598725 RepID=UPI0011CB5F85|nr:S9 family peptidase [Vulcaniibacterium gelatinicum]